MRRRDFIALLIPILISGTCSAQSYHNHHQQDFIDIPETSIIMKNIGVILQEEKYVGLDSNNLMLSLFVKSKYPVVKPGNLASCPSHQIGTKAMEMINATLDEYNRLFTELLELDRSDMPIGNSTLSRNRRSILGFFNLGLNLFSTAISGLNQYRISKQVTQLKRHFEDFVEFQEEVNAKNVQIHKKFVKILQKIELKVAKALQKIECEVKSEMVDLAETMLANEYITHLKELLAPLDEGTLTGQLNHKILPLSALKHLLREHPSLNGTIYTDMSAALMYKASEIMVAEIRTSEEGIVIHYIMTTPYLTLQNTFQKFTIKKVKVMVAPKSCAILDIPTKVVKSGEKFYKLEDTICSDGPIELCYSQPAKYLPEVKCLTNPAECSFVSVPCDDFQYIFDKTGILLYHKMEVQALLRNTRKTTGIKLISPPGNRVSFLPWATYSLVQVMNHNVLSPTFISTSFEEGQVLELNFTKNNYPVTNMSALMQLVEQNDRKFMFSPENTLIWPSLLAALIAIICSVLVTICILKTECTPLTVLSKACCCGVKHEEIEQAAKQALEQETLIVSD